MAAQAKFAIFCRDLQKALFLPAMRGVATAAIAPGKRHVLAKESFLRAGLRMAGKTKIGLLFFEQASETGLVRGMAIKAQAFFSGHMWPGASGILLAIMAGEAKLGRFIGQKRLAFAGMPAVTGQAFALTSGSMHTSHLLFALSLLMTIQTNFLRISREHSYMVAGVCGVAHLAVAFLNRDVLGRFRNVEMTGNTQTAFKRLQGDRIA